MAEKNYVKVGGQLQNIVGDGIIAYSKEIKDEVSEKTQEQINTELQQGLEGIEEIESLIPAQASASNQLADKNFVNNQVSTNTANFVGTYNSLAELQAVQNPTNNDYGFVIETDAQGNEYYDRYKYNGSQWLFEYKVESTPFTAEQWAAIQSGITSALVTKLSALPTNVELTTQLNGKQATLVSGTNIKTINNEQILGAGNIEIGGAVDSVNGKTGVVVLNANDVGAASAEDLQDVVDDVATNTQDIENLQAAYAGLTQNDIIPLTSLPASGVANTIYRIAGTNSYTDYMWNGTEFIPMATYDNAIDDVPTKGSNNLVTSGGVFNYTKSVVPFVATSNNLADAVAEVPTEERCAGKIVEFTDADGNHQKYKFMGKYYTDEDWNSMASATTFGAWLDLNNADKYRVYYFRLTPTREGEIKGTIDTNGNITESASGGYISDYLEIPEDGLNLSGGFYNRYVAYDENKTKLSTAIIYGGVTITRGSGRRYVRAAGALNWKCGYTQGSSSSTPPRNAHVEVVENFEDLIDYNNPDGWQGSYSPFIRLKKGETITAFTKSGGLRSGKYINIQKYDLEFNASGPAVNSPTSYTMTMDGYVKIGANAAGLKAFDVQKDSRISKSIALTTAKKRLLVVGDSTSIYTYSTELEKDVSQGYPYFTAIEGDHEISVTNQAVSGNTCGQQFTKLQDHDLSVYDAITIFVGTNNYGYNTTAATFKTELETMVNYIIAQKPSIKIGLLTLLHRASAWNSETSTEVVNAGGSVLSDFSNAIKEVGQKYSIPVLDIWNECQCNFNYSTYVTNYSSNGDGLHPTNEAHKLFIYPLYREFIKRLFAE